MHDYLEEDTISAESIAVRRSLRHSVRGAVFWVGVDQSTVVTFRGASLPASMRGAIELVDADNHGYPVVHMVPVVESDDEW
ncbi:hypothetical protein OEB99_01510 [Actinotalea sp. M2MS4P-6]|uniref:hypothetical protein n=1 Tax=Actinotalea sp. M2MS4P-6 TaxID=2983762 RepID=UPI0021E44B07|nr:hypothetical protein [Actinotalea sp. M2MS4P-6]MCV2392974.1 hypothetical protein [Actinotalea sp. M2MS4P-6]